MCFSTKLSMLIIEKSTLLKHSAFDFALAGGLLITAHMIELTQSRVCGTGMNMLTFEFDMLMTVHMAVSHFFCENV